MATTAGWDVQDAFYSRQQGSLLNDDEVDDGARMGSVGTTAGAPEVNGLKGSQVKQKFRQFILSFTTERYRFKYRERLTRAVNAGEYVLLVDFDDLQNFDAALAGVVRSNPTNFLPMLYKAANEAAARLDNRQLNENGGPIQDVDADQWAENRDGEELPSIQVLFASTENPRQIRALQSSSISRMVRVTGIVIAASTNMIRATKVKLQCKGCSETISLDIKSGIGGVTVPMYCARRLAEGESSDCPPSPYTVLPDQGEYTDQQNVKLQELPEQVPTGEMPRSIQLSLERSLVSKAVPGMRISVIGVYSINSVSMGKAAKGAQGKTKLNIRTPYIRVVGLNVEDDAGGGGRALVSAFDTETEEEMNRIARLPNLYEMISKSIAPEIFGFEDIKKATAALLFGGSRKFLPDGMRIRGDINVLLLGDPSTAKSQMLKFAEKVAPISVYTSGKGSSAAGLTASVVRDAGHGGEFHLEGGAMVLADGGVVCIDEFDKMRLADRVAIHEAMEQQTISVAKAGITAVLNARSSVLAAANPAFGRYDDTRSASENIEFQSTILSRFDLIFIVRDIRSAERDATIAKHVLGLHQRGGAANVSTSRSDEHIDINTLKKYIAFARSRSSPRLTPEAVEVLRNSYVTIRQEMREAEFGGGEAPQVPITVRQLEAIVRLSESLAKMTLSPTATEQHVTEAIRLFKVATLESANAGGVQRLEGTMRPEFLAEVQACEDAVKRRLPVGSTASDRRMREDLQREGHTLAAVSKALEVMIVRRELEPRSQRKKIYRAR